LYLSLLNVESLNIATYLPILIFHLSTYKAFTPSDLGLLFPLSSNIGLTEACPKLTGLETKLFRQFCSSLCTCKQVNSTQHGKHKKSSSLENPQALFLLLHGAMCVQVHICAQLCTVGVCGRLTQSVKLKSLVAHTIHQHRHTVQINSFHYIASHVATCTVNIHRQLSDTFDTLWTCC
jgi:hypothetical protein